MASQTNFTEVTAVAAARIARTSAWITLTKVSSTDEIFPTSTARLSSTSSSRVTSSRSDSSAVIIFAQLCLATGLIGLAANGVVLFVLFYKNHVRKNATNKFICNQAVLDAIACLGLLVYVLVESDPEGPYGVREGPYGWIRCLIFDSLAWMVSAIYASQSNLVVIAIERYAMIVHPVGHRKHFRQWMVSVGLVIPWLDGALTYFVPSMATTKVFRGRCGKFLFWPKPDMFKAYVVAITTWQILIPTLFLVFCYANIVSVVRRQTVAIGVASGTTSNVHHQPPAPSAGAAYGVPTAARLGNDATAGSSQGVTSVENAKSTVSKTEKRVVRTMIVVVMFFIICWFPVSMTTMIYIFVDAQETPGVSLFLTLIAYLNPVVNPVIYGAHFNVIREVQQAIGQLRARLEHSVAMETSTLSASGGSHADGRGPASHHGARTVTTVT